MFTIKAIDAGDRFVETKKLANLNDACQLASKKIIEDDCLGYVIFGPQGSVAATVIPAFDGQAIISRFDGIINCVNCGVAGFECRLCGTRQGYDGA